MTLQDRMKEAGVKQKDIAEKANVTPAAVSLVSRGLSVSKKITDIANEEIEKKKKEQENTEEQKENTEPKAHDLRHIHSNRK